MADKKSTAAKGAKSVEDATKKADKAVKKSK